MPSLLPRNKFRHFLPVLALPVAFLFGGCDISDLTASTCGLSSDAAHCNQEAAVEANNEKDCDKVAQKEEFKKFDSNPPRDKCIIMIAANSEDPSKCNAIKGGVMSYSKDDCNKAIADTARDPNTCSKLGGDVAGCVNRVAEKTFNDIDRLNKMSKKSDQDIQDVQKVMADMQKMQEMMSNINKSNYDTKMSIVRNLR